MTVKYTKNFHFKALENLPKLPFLFEKIPSGNPGPDPNSCFFQGFDLPLAKFDELNANWMKRLYEARSQYNYRMMVTESSGANVIVTNPKISFFFKSPFFNIF
jgi:hypothetical protein